MKNGFTHDAPLSLQLRPFKNFSISPQVSYKGVMYTRKYVRRWDPDNQKVVYDTLKGAFYGHAINPSFSAGYSPQIFGTFDFIDAIRHVMKPSIGFSFIPAIDGLSSKMYDSIQTDVSGKKIQYSIFEGNIYGTPSLASKSGSVSFNLTNILEAKVFDRRDTTGKSKNVRLIDNFGISTSYSIFADSMHWSPVSMVMRTTLFEKIGISANSSFSMYGVNSKGNSIDTYYFTQVHKLLRLTNFSMGLDFSLSDLLKRKDDKKKSTAPAGANSPGIQRPGVGGAPAGALNAGAGRLDTYGYPEFNVPWTMNVRYSFNYTKYALKPTISKTMSVNGNVKLTSKMAITYSSGYDFDEKKITMTQIGVTRDLHCWNMAFSWIPNGSMKMWTFSINVKASVLADLKYERRKDFHDNY
jgi:hypothetical protein